MNTNVLTESARGVTAQRVRDVLFNNRKVFFVEDVNPRSCVSLIEDLLYLDTDPDKRPITLYINSNGGDIISGLGVYNVIQTMQCQVNTVCIGIAASMGAILFLAGENRTMYEHASIMIHSPRIVLPGQGAFMTPDTMDEKVNELNKFSKITKDIISERTGLSPQTVEQFLQKDTYFDAEDAVRNNIATNIKQRKGANNHE